MSDNGRSPSKLLVYALALPVFAVVYLTTFGGRIWAALRPAIAAFLGVTVISTVYAETAYKRAGATPMRAAAVLALAVVLVGPAVAPAPVQAADPAAAVIAAARQYVGHGYRLGAEGPKQFDCSGFIFRAFSDAGELPRIGGMRLRAAGYMRYFVSRGRYTKNEAKASPGDLVVYARGAHIGIYLGHGKVISALIDPWGITVHSLNGIHLKVSYFLRIDWSGGDGSSNPGDGGGKGNGNGGKGKGNGGNNGNDNPADTASADNGSGKNNGGDKNDKNGKNKPDNKPTVAGDKGSNHPSSKANAMAVGTMNMRTSADPDARVIGWVGRNSYFTILDQGNSPAGYLWYQVETRSGKVGWIYSRWVKPL